MVYVAWVEWGICPFHAMMNRECKFGATCKWRHPPEAEVKGMWDAAAKGVLPPPPASTMPLDQPIEGPPGVPSGGHVRPLEPPPALAAPPIPSLDGVHDACAARPPSLPARPPSPEDGLPRFSTDYSSSSHPPSLPARPPSPEGGVRGFSSDYPSGTHEEQGGLDGTAILLNDAFPPTTGAARGLVDGHKAESEHGTMEMHPDRLKMMGSKEDDSTPKGMKKARAKGKKREVRSEKVEPDATDVKSVGRKRLSRADLELELQAKATDEQQQQTSTSTTTTVPPPAKRPALPPLPFQIAPWLTDMGTKRLSNGEAKAVGPHPSTIRVSAPYITQAAVDKCLQPASLDVQERSLAEAREDSVRLQGVTWLDQVRRALQLPTKTYTTACVYYHQFRLAHPNVEYSWADAAAASLLVSCKNEDTFKKSRDILAAAYNLKQPGTHEQVGADDPMFEAPSKVVAGLERLVLESAGFDFRSKAPHKRLVKIGQSLPQSADLRAVCELAFTILTDLHRTFAPLKQTPSTMAFACLELAVSFHATKSDDNTCTVKDDLHAVDLKKWSTTREEIMETLLDALDLYTHNTGSTVLGTKYSLDDLLRIRLALNKECSDSNLPRYAVVQPPSSPQNTNGTGGTLRVANGHPTPVSPPQGGTQAPQSNTAAAYQPVPENGVTLRFMLDPQRATDERSQVNRYFTEDWEEYKEEIEVPIPRNERDRRDRPDRDRDVRPIRDHDDRRGPRDNRISLPARERERERERLRESLADREREAERERAMLRDRERERRYDDRRYEDRERDRDRRYDDRRDRDRDRRYYDEDRRRGRDDRR